MALFQGGRASDGYIMVIFRIWFAAIVSASLALVGCGSGEFEEGRARSLVQGGPVRIEAEYVMLTPAQVQCGVQNELWDAPVEAGGRSIARLTAKGRDLQFSDDVSIGDLRQPYVQIRGDFPLSMTEFTSVKEGPGKDTKLVEAKLGALLQHPCFPNALPMLGVRRGKFAQDASPILLFHNDNGWSLEKLVH